MTGNSDIKINETGTRELHQRHRTALEQGEGAFLRVKVTDQLYIDKLLLSKNLDLQQHSTAEWVLKQAMQANVFVKSPSMMGTFGGGSGDKYTNGLLIFSRTMRKIKNKFGVEAEKIVFDIVVDDLNIKDKEKLKTLRRALDFLSN
tara:strand:- start:1168 stop:1605 length:438 start_codon:yes stop_codon:yes gene_type:complete